MAGVPAGKVGTPPEGAEGRRRVVIEAVTPEVDCGRFAAKRVAGDTVAVEALVFADGHDVLAAAVLHRREEETSWREGAMRPLGGDRWRGSFPVDAVGRYRYTVRAWVDRFATWRAALAAKADAGQDVAVDLLAGADLVAEAASRAAADDAGRLRRWESRLRSPEDAAARLAAAGDEALAELMAAYPDLSAAATYPRELTLVVDPPLARFGAWYELFPRSCGEGGSHGTLADCAARLDDIAAMGFDVVYLPPIHPIGRTHRKGPNNTLAAGGDFPGSPWAIGSEEGGHTSVHPRLGTLDDFRGLVGRARERGLDVALDIAFQCSPDHPWVREHPAWFRHRPDGTIQYAENPPKRYEDIVPLDFETAQWRELWAALLEVVRFWAAQGVRVFRADNPHTKPFAFWEWLIAEVKSEWPEAVFLAEAFTRPAVMQRLAKAGFTQSYTYFAWRNTRRELEQYFRELAAPGLRDFFRPNLWPNTPDILTEYLQVGGRPAFAVRLVLAATLGASYGVYGPAFERCEAVPRAPGSEEYLDSEKYQVRDWGRPGDEPLRGLVTRLNRVRRDNPALQRDDGLRFHGVDNDDLICFSKASEDASNVIVVVANLDPAHRQSGWVTLDLGALGLGGGQAYQVHDLIGDARFLWHGARNYVELDPAVMPAHVLRLRRRVRTEHDFEYYL